MNPYIRLAEAIERGHTMIGENKFHYLSLPGREPCGCALGAAVVGSGMTIKEYWAARIKSNIATAPYIAEHFGISESLALDISRKHCSGIPRLAIAKWLRTLPEAQEPAAPQESPSVATEEIPQGASVPVDAAAHKWADEKVKSPFKVPA